MAALSSDELISERGMLASKKVSDIQSASFSPKTMSNNINLAIVDSAVPDLREIDSMVEDFLSFIIA